MKNIYVASSWRNPWQPAVVQQLRAWGHDVYDFRAPVPGEAGFRWSEIDGNWQAWTPSQYRRSLASPIAEHGFRRDMDALSACDVCILVQPCGNSAHLELGWAAGAGKRTAVLFPFGFSETRIDGHSMHANATCPACGDLDGCHLPAKLLRIEPELMVKCADAVLLDRYELEIWAKEG